MKITVTVENPELGVLTFAEGVDEVFAVYKAEYEAIPAKHNGEMPYSVWVYSVTYNNGDTSSPLDLDVTLHINRRFEAQSVALEITTLTPDSLRYSESVTLPVRVRWTSNRAKTTDIEIPYRRDVHFAHKGVYHISLRPLQDVVGVEAAGITFQTKR